MQSCNDVIDQVTCTGEVWQLSAHMHLKASCPNYEKVIIIIWGDDGWHMIYRQ